MVHKDDVPQSAIWVLRSPHSPFTPLLRATSLSGISFLPGVLGSYFKGGFWDVTTPVTVICTHNALVDQHHSNLNIDTNSVENIKQ